MLLWATDGTGCDGRLTPYGRRVWTQETFKGRVSESDTVESRMTLLGLGYQENE